MGRTPLREAIKRLALENLVTVFPRRGTFASEINITDLALDLATCAGSSRATPHIAPPSGSPTTQRASSQRCWTSSAPAAASDDVEALMALDARVHRFIYRCAGNPYLDETLGRYFNLSLRIWHLVLDRLPHLFARVHEHEEVLHAIAAGEPDRARVLDEHIATFERRSAAVL